MDLNTSRMESRDGMIVSVGGAAGSGYEVMPGPVVNEDHPFVYAFGVHTDGSAEMRDLLGGTGAKLAETARIGLPAPPGFTLGTEVCSYLYDHAGEYPEPLSDQVAIALEELEE